MSSYSTDGTDLGTGGFLVQSPKEFHTKETEVAGRLDAANSGGDGGRLVRDGAEGRGCRRRSGYREMEELVRSEDMSRGDTRSSRADIERLGELNKLDARRIGTANKNGHLELDSGRATRRRIVQALPYL